MVGNLLDLSRIEGGALRPDKEWYDVGELVADVAGRLAEPRRAAIALTTEVEPDLPLVLLRLRRDRPGADQPGRERASSTRRRGPRSSSRPGAVPARSSFAVARQRAGHPADARAAPLREVLPGRDHRPACRAPASGWRSARGWSRRTAGGSGSRAGSGRGRPFGSRSRSTRGRRGRAVRRSRGVAAAPQGAAARRTASGVDRQREAGGWDERWKRVLVVDDEPQIRRALRTALGWARLRGEVAEDGEAALTTLASRPPDAGGARPGDARGGRVRGAAPDARPGRRCRSSSSRRAGRSATRWRRSTSARTTT